MKLLDFCDLPGVHAFQTMILNTITIVIRILHEIKYKKKNVQSN